ncbi:uncharacterized protein Z519_12317 [Cladophialophora bantiana CBS 173.52]|uniref:Heterokaryon incompatibility domain-containing protein n=1 Tax=Cladophialophora bantiana (strain ATCC 10958 / CBS 173.52 / CDC B-1940 / NIH 8579) TaxID=1442370 RepID=A0A0D2H857_CLAB1|nr:uncharacterized protein Z519_12317 [Cladophialophora bantiana CBS 173.52]KIW87020.1 hypothetical protein Z519_12317 [Cladophialophora bantiana CBS 173.52]
MSFLKEMISWDLVQLAAHEIDYQSLVGRSNQRGLDKVQNVMSIEMLGSNDSGLFPTLCATRDFQATDPRDKVFAVLGLTQEASSSLAPDYNLSVSEVYRQAVRFLVQSIQDLTVLGDIDHSATEQSSAKSNNFSSWTPRYDKPRTCSILVRAYPPFQAAGQRIDMETIPSDSHSLALGGLRIDTLAVLGPVMTSDMIANGSGLCQIWNQCLNFVTSYPTGEHVLRAFSLTMAADKTLKGESAATDPNHDEDFAAYITETGHELKHLSSREHDALVLRAITGNALRYEGAVAMISTGRRFFTTGEGFMGLCPSGAKENDLVCVFFGGPLLYIIRPEENLFRFVGACYVHGRMDGSAVEEQIRHFAPMEMFSLH